MPRVSAVIAAAVLAASVVQAPAARGQPGAIPVGPAPPPSVETRWYGWQILAIDVVSGVALAAGDGSAPQGVGVGGLVLGGPVVHLIHGHGGRAAGSLALRLGAPFVGGLLLSSTCGAEEYDDGFGCLDEVAVGVLIGASIAVAFDLLQARDEVEVAPAIVPAVTVSERGAQLGVVGRF